MVQFNELYITPDNKRLVIEAQVKDLQYYDNVYISRVIIDNQDTYKENTPSNDPVYTYDVESNSKKVRLELDYTDLTINNKMLFVYIQTTGNPASNTPCGMDNQTTLGVVINRYTIYKYIITNLKTLNNTCVPPAYFIDGILKIKALDLAIDTGHYIEAIKLYNKFYSKVRIITINNNCNCNG